MLKTILLVTILVTQWKPPAPQDFQVETDEVIIYVVEEIQEPGRGQKGKAFIRKLAVRYKVPSSDRREDQMAALFLGASNEDAGAVDAAQYEGAAIAESPELHYVRVKFYAGARLIAMKEITLKNDLHNLRAKRIFTMAREYYDKQKKLGIK